jgi:hypothetical protein
MKKYHIEFTDSKIVYSEEQDIFLAPDLKGLGDIVEFESDKMSFQFLHDLKIKFPDETIISVSEIRNANTDDARMSVLLGYGFKDRDLLLDANNLYWEIPSAKFITLKADNNGTPVTYYMWALREKDIQSRIDAKCEAMKTPYISHSVESVDEAKLRVAKANEVTPAKKKPVVKKPVTKKPRKKSNKERLKEYNNSREYEALPRKKKKERKKKEDRDKESANKPAPLKELYGTKKERLSGKGKSREELPLCESTYVKFGKAPKQKKPKAERTGPKPVPKLPAKPKEKKLSPHQLHLQRRHIKKNVSENLRELNETHRKIHRAHVGPVSWNRDVKQLPSDAYHEPMLDMKVTIAAEAKYLHYIKMCRSLTVKCDESLAELNRFRNIIAKYQKSKSERKKEKAVRIENTIIPQLKATYRRYGELYNDAARLREKWSKKVDALLAKDYVPKVKPSTKQAHGVHLMFEKKERKPNAPKVCMTDNNDGSIIRISVEAGEKLFAKDPERYTYTGREQWKEWKKKNRKGEYNPGVIAITQERAKRENITPSGKLLRDRLGPTFAHPKFERGMAKMENRSVRERRQSMNHYGARPIIRKQTIVVKPEEETEVVKGSFVETYTALLPSYNTFTFAGSNKKSVGGPPITDKHGKVINRRGEKIRVWIRDSETGKFVLREEREVKFAIKKIRKVPLQTYEVHYKYTRRNKPITKTIEHDVTYTDSTSTAKLKTFGKSAPRKPNHKMKMKHAHYRTGEVRVPVSKTERGKRTKANRMDKLERLKRAREKAVEQV